MSHPVRITIIEPSVIIRGGILSVLHRLNTIQMDVFEITEMDQLKSALGLQNPDILIINPSVLSLFSLKQIKKEITNPQLRCIALQNFLSDINSLKVYDEVISIYDTSEQINEKLMRLIVEPEEENRLESLTLREKEIIVCVIKGMTNKQIAEKLFLSSHTVISHRRNIAAKLQIHSAAGLTIYAIVNNLVNLNEINE
jgi:DNA-binding NarL/FixJ family response regulator